MSDALQGKRILVTRPANQSQNLMDLLKAQGAEPVSLPLIRIVPPEDWDEFDAAFSDIEKYSWLIFASVNAVESTVNRLRTLRIFEKLNSVKIACVGASTAAALPAHGLTASMIPEQFVAESLVSEFAELHETNRRVLWPRTNIGRLTLKQQLKKIGWTVDLVHSYITLGPADPERTALDLSNMLQNERLDIITLASSETARQLDQILKLALAENGLESEPFANVKLAVIGPETAKTCLQLFGRVDIQANPFSAEGLVDAIVASS